MTEIHPPFYGNLGPAPAGVCSRWVAGSPCGAAGTHHVIWDLSMTNGCLCPAHVAEARRQWVYVGLHPYTAACASAGRSVWLAGEDRCVLPDDQPAAAGQASAVSPA